MFKCLVNLEDDLSTNLIEDKCVNSSCNTIISHTVKDILYQPDVYIKNDNRALQCEDCGIQ